MEKVIINSYEDFEKLVGQQIGVSEYVELPQERINLFADATLDHQWIHVDTERAKVESPFKSTIAHGYLTLSMLPYLWNQSASSMLHDQSAYRETYSSAKWSLR